jgi:replicative DNA helicase
VNDEYDRPAHERTPPHDLAAERGVLGGMLMSDEAITEVAGFLKPSEFYEPRHEQIYDAILALHAQRRAVDTVTVADLLTKRGQLSKVGGPPYLHDLIQSVPSAANAGYYAEIVHDKASLYGLIKVGTRLVQMGHATDDSDAAEAIDEAQAALHALARSGADTDPTVADALEDVLEDIAHGTNPGMPTGFHHLDELTDGLHGGELILIAGRPAMGKSVAGLDIARHASVNLGKHALVFSFEMNRKVVTNRLLSAVTEVPLHHLKHGRATDEDWDRIAKDHGKLSGAPLAIVDTPGMTIGQIRAKARWYKERYDTALIVVDYVQLIEAGGGRRENRQQDVSAISRGLKLMAGELDVPVVALAQLNRGPESRPDKKPMMADLRESGSLEQDADVVILLFREDYYEPESPRAGEADWIMTKNRHGHTATMTLSFKGHYSKFVNMGQG